MINYKTTVPPLKPTAQTELRQGLNIFVDGLDNPIGEQLTPTQLTIIDIILHRRYARTQLLLPTRYGKSLSVALAVLWRTAFKPEKWAIIAPTEEKARIIMDYIIEHIFDDTMFVSKLDYNGTKEKLKQERSKTRLTFRGGGEVRVYTADARNRQNVKKALMGFGSPNVILDESSLIDDDLYSTVKRMLGDSKDNFMLEIGNPFYRNHFLKSWLGTRYEKIFVDDVLALQEGRYSEDYLQEMAEEAFYDVLYQSHFPEDEDAPSGYRSLLSLAHIDNSFILNDLPLGHNADGSLIDKPVLGIDPNAGGKNYTAMVVRYPFTGFAKLVLKKQYRESGNVTEDIAADAIKIIEEYDIGDYRTGIDAGNGGGVADALERKGYAIERIMFGQAAEEKDRFANAKAELYMNLRKWIINDNGKLVKDDGFLELKEINYKENTSSKVQMESKEELSKRGVASPDVADALALTFITTSNIVEEEDIDII